jgi:hypothetical protein
MPLYPPSGGGGGFANPMTTAGDLILGGAAGIAQRLGVGADGDSFIVDSGEPVWASISAAPASSWTPADYGLMGWSSDLHTNMSGISDGGDNLLIATVKATVTGTVNFLMLISNGAVADFIPGNDQAVIYRGPTPGTPPVDLPLLAASATSGASIPTTPGIAFYVPLVTPLEVIAGELYYGGYVSLSDGFTALGPTAPEGVTVNDINIGGATEVTSIPAPDTYTPPAFNPTALVPWVGFSA